MLGSMPAASSSSDKFSLQDKSWREKNKEKIMRPLL
jgi:hypothetical protein